MTFDIHCVTKWSKFDTSWTGVRVRDLFERAGVQAGATHVMEHAEFGYTTNVPLADITSDEAIVAYAYDGEPIEPIHGGPVRIVVPHLYFWKSAKWVRGLELRDSDEPGLLGAQRLPQLRRPVQRTDDTGATEAAEWSARFCHPITDDRRTTARGGRRTAPACP